MTTPIIMLCIATGPYLVIVLLRRLRWSTKIDPRVGGRIGLALLLVFTGIGHFIKTEPMTQMLPPWAPARHVVVYFTGLVEFALAGGLLVPQTKRVTGWIVIAMLISFLPVYIYAAVNRIPMGGHAWGPIYLLIRVLLQLILIAWAYQFAVRESAA